MFTGATMRPWQEALELYLSGEVDSRSVIWMWDVAGNVGKSWFATYCAVKHDAFVIGNGKSADIKYAYRGQRIVIFDFSRTQQEHVNYQVVEDLKNGRYFSTKYISEMRVYAPPHVICFSNCEPKYEALSTDRWCVIDIAKDNVDACLSALSIIADSPMQALQEISESLENYYGSPMGRVESEEGPPEEDNQSQDSVASSYIEPGQRYTVADRDAVLPFCQVDQTLGSQIQVSGCTEFEEMGGQDSYNSGRFCVITGSDNSCNIDAFYDVLNMK